MKNNSLDENKNDSFFLNQTESYPKAINAHNKTIGNFRVVVVEDYNELLSYVIKHKENFSRIKTWPEEILKSNI